MWNYKILLVWLGLIIFVAFEFSITAHAAGTSTIPLTPRVPPLLNQSTGNACYTISNLAQRNYVNITLNGTKFNILLNFIAPTFAGFMVNNVSNTYRLNETTVIGSNKNYTYTAELTNVSYKPIENTVTLLVCSIRNKQPIFVGISTPPMNTSIFYNSTAAIVVSNPTFLKPPNLTEINRFVQAVAIAVLAFLTLKTLTLVLFAYKSYDRQSKKKGKNDAYRPLVSILAPCYNEGLTLTNCIKGLVDQTYENIEILIINDGSTDNTQKVAEGLALQYPKIRVMSKKNGGKASALNYGLEYALGEIVVCIDGDTIFKRDAVERLVSSFDDPKVVAVAGNVRIANASTILSKNQSLEYITGQNLEKRTFSYLNCVQVISGCIGAFKKDKLKEVGGYSADTMVEDMDLTLALAKKGYKIVYNPEAIAYTEGPTDLKSFMKQRYRWSYGRYEVLKKYRGMMFQKRYGSIGTFGLPYYLILPWVDVMASSILILTFVIALMLGSLFQYMVSFLLFMVPLLALVMYVLYIDGPLNNKELSLYAIPQSIYYSLLLTYINVKAGIDHRMGVKAGWNKLRRLGANVRPNERKYSEKQKNEN